jgi:hypothetical protein
LQRQVISKRAETEADITSVGTQETRADITSVRTQETAKIRTPHPHDVLTGRGDIRGPIYRHAGNIQYRAWILQRRPKYRVASNRELKRLIVREIIALVQNQNPPGRFLQCGPIHASSHTSWWLETDDDKAVENTRYALGRGSARTDDACGDELGGTESRGEEEFERPEKRGRFDGNGEAEPSGITEFARKTAFFDGRALALGVDETTSA